MRVPTVILYIIKQSPQRAQTSAKETMVSTELVCLSFSNMMLNNTQQQDGPYDTRDELLIIYA